MLKFSIYLLVLHNRSVESCSTMSGVSVFGILEVLLLAPLFVLDILVILCVMVTLCVLDILVLLCVLDIIALLCFLDILVLLYVLIYCYHMMCTELLCNKRRLHTQNHLQQGDTRAVCNEQIRPALIPDPFICRPPCFYILSGGG